MTQSVILTPPIPAYQNVPIQPLYYLPSRFVITDISEGVTTIITTSEDNNYVIGQLCRLNIPQKYGAGQLNGRQGYVISIPASNQVELDINSLNYDPFNPSPTFLPFQSQTQPQILAIGDITSGAINSNGRIPTSTFIPGSFINISPELTT